MTNGIDHHQGNGGTPAKPSATPKSPPSTKEPTKPQQAEPATKSKD